MNKQPVLALVGRPNVGKSTLFNALTRTREALVADEEGVTRDRQYGHVFDEEGNSAFLLIDTGGLTGSDDDPLRFAAESQSQLAIEEADGLLLVVDARVGCTPYDTELMNTLRKTGVPVLLVVNKSEALPPESAAAEFQRLGAQQICPTAAAHNRGIRELKEHCLSYFAEHTDRSGSAQHAAVGDNPNADAPDQAIVVALIGQPNAGKSTLFNRMLAQKRSLVSNISGTTRDTVREHITRDAQNFTLIDTAGIRKKNAPKGAVEHFSVVKSLQAIEEAHVVVYLIDATVGITAQDRSLMGLVVERGRALVVVCNKWDHLPQDDKDNIERVLKHRLKFVAFATLRMISALHGTHVGSLWGDCQEAYMSAMKSFSTQDLNNWLQEAVHANPPPIHQGRRIKIKYAHMGGHNPPRIILHGNQLNDLPESYLRYLKRRLREKYDLKGTPIHIHCATAYNPYS